MPKYQFNWYLAEKLLAKEPLTSGGHILSYKDRRRVANALILECLLMEDVSEVLADKSALLDASVDFKKCSRVLSHKNILKWLLLVSRSDVADIISNFKSGLQLIRHMFSKNMTVTSFNRLCNEYGYDRNKEYNKLFLNTLLRSVWRTRDSFLYREVNTLVQFMTRLTLCDVDWVEEAEIQKYKDFEISLQDTIAAYDSVECDVIISEMREIVSEWFRGFSFENAKGQHGYGATYEVKKSQGTAAKYRFMRFGVKTSIACRLVDWTPLDTVWPGLSEINRTYHTKTKGLIGEPVERRCRYNLVPKGIDSKRGVSMEETTNQFFQKIGMQVLKEWFKHHPNMRIDLENQNHNAVTSTAASGDYRFGTADLTSASDSVTWELVKRVFCDTGDLYKFLVCTRTKLVELPDGTVMHMKKAYPMGSALCFPIECIIFSAVIAAAARHLGIHRRYWVYGDDLVIPRDLWDLSIAYLKRLGFIVNMDKSFSPDCAFKESCGAEGLDGFSVEPIRLSRKWDVTSLSVGFNPQKNKHSQSTMLTALYDLGNQAFWRSYKRLRRWCIRTAEYYYCGHILFSHNENIGFISYQATLNSHLKVLSEETKAKTRTYKFTGDSRMVFEMPARCDFPQGKYFKVLGVSSSICKGEDLLRYSLCLETYDARQRNSLSLPEDRIESAVGAALTKITYVRVPCDSCD